MMNNRQAVEFRLLLHLSCNQVRVSCAEVVSVDLDSIEKGERREERGEERREERGEERREKRGGAFTPRLELLATLYNTDVYVDILSGRN